MSARSRFAAFLLGIGILAALLGAWKAYVSMADVSAFVLPPVALALYALYESGIPSEINIRVDLLLIYPALTLDFLFWPALLVRYLVFRRA